MPQQKVKKSTDKSRGGFKIEESGEVRITKVSSWGTLPVDHHGNAAATSMQGAMERMKETYQKHKRTTRTRGT
jgi:hypothetical protein